MTRQVSDTHTCVFNQLALSVCNQLTNKVAGYRMGVGDHEVA